MVRGARWAVAIASMLTACGGDGTLTGEAHSSSPLRFTRMGAECGITRAAVNGDPSKPFILESLGQGAAVLDYDGDGLLDLFVANGGVYEEQAARRVEARHALYRNLGELRFEDVTTAAGLDFEGWAHGAWRVDFDADSRPDLYVTLSDGPNRFFRNAGGGRFEDVTASWGGADELASTAAVFFDADRDGDLDLYVGNYVRFDRNDPPNGGRPCEWHGLQVYCGPQGLRAAPDSFWENRGGRLERAEVEHGFAAVAPSYALGAIAADFDDDGDQDLFVANDSEDSYFFENQGSGGFVEQGRRRHVSRNHEERAQADMGVAAADFDGDGALDLYLTTFSHDNDTLFRNTLARDGVASFEDVSLAAGLGLVTRAPLSWGVEPVDLDRDGRLDLVIATGHVYPQVDSVESGTTYAQREQVLLNRAGSSAHQLRFEEWVAPERDAFAAATVARGLVAADLDEDGDVDFLLVEIDRPPMVVRNDSAPPGAWIGLQLIAAGLNTEAIGARAWIEDAGGRVQLRERPGGGGYLSSSDPRLLVGLGSASGPVQVTVRWPSGATTVHRDLTPARYHVLREPTVHDDATIVESERSVGGSP